MGPGRIATVSWCAQNDCRVIPLFKGSLRVQGAGTHEEDCKPLRRMGMIAPSFRVVSGSGKPFGGVLFEAWNPFGWCQMEGETTQKKEEGALFEARPLKKNKTKFE